MLLPLDKARLAFPPASSLYAKLTLPGDSGSIVSFPLLAISNKQGGCILFN